jgi:hypothetical protein
MEFLRNNEAQQETHGTVSWTMNIRREHSIFTCINNTPLTTFTSASHGTNNTVFGQTIIELFTSCVPSARHATVVTDKRESKATSSPWNV